MNLLSALKSGKFLLVLLVTALLFQPVTDPDLYGHLLYGQTMVDWTLSAPTIDVVRTNTFSFATPDATWIDHEWAYQILLWTIYTLGKSTGLVTFQLGISFAFAILLVILQTEHHDQILLAGSCLLLPLFGLRYGFSLRPQIITYTGTGLVFLLCWNWDGRTSGYLLAFPLIFLVWSNMHGGFAAGLFVLVALVPYLLKSTADSSKTASWFIITVLTSILITLINPYGINLWQLVAEASLNPFTRQFIVDWRPLISRFGLFLVGLGLLVQALVWWAVSPSTDRTLKLLPIGLTAIMAFMSLRNLPILAVAVAATCKWSKTTELDVELPLQIKQTLVVLASVGLLGIILVRFSFGLVVAQRFTPSIIARPLLDESFSGTVFSHYNWSQWLLFKNRDISVYIDGRYDTAYPEKTIQRYVNIVNGNLSLLNRSDAGWVLSPHWYPLNSKLKDSNQWHRARSSPRGILWRRRP